MQVYVHARFPQLLSEIAVELPALFLQHLVWPSYGSLKLSFLKNNAKLLSSLSSILFLNSDTSVTISFTPLNKSIQQWYWWSVLRTMVLLCRFLLYNTAVQERSLEKPIPLRLVDSFQ